MSYKYRLKSILAINHLLLIAGLLLASWEWLMLSFVGWILFGKVGGEVALHRYFAHNSFETGMLRRKLLLFLSIFNCFGSPILWCGIHRKHHHNSDEKGDPHGAQAGWKIWSTFWEPFEVDRRYVSDLIKDKTIKLIHKYYLRILLSSYIMLAAIDWRIAVFLISVPAVITFHSAGAVNVICHKLGYRLFNTSDKSTNNFWVNLITLGSGLHNTHHAKPNSWSNKELWYELDFPGWIIKTFFLKLSAQRGLKDQKAKTLKSKRAFWPKRYNYDNTI